MERRKIGDLDVSVVGLGCNNFGMRIDADQTKAVVDAAIEAGINYFDTAEVYGGGASEELLGAAVQGRRDQVLIATKWGIPGADDGPRPGSRAAIRTAVEGSLRRLGTDYIDHYQLHRPDPDTPIGETLSALAELCEAGTVRAIGCSNFSAEQIDEAATVADELGIAPFASVQNRYSILTRDPESDGVLEACARRGVAFVPFFPLESGVLTGKYQLHQPPPADSRVAAWGERADRFYNDERLREVTALTEWAAARGHSVLDLAVSWLASNPLVATVICGATKPDQVRANAEAASWIMSETERSDALRALSV
jgi:aryl-alcohol dehydrogenase-like predicted oxidoreductase